MFRTNFAPSKLFSRFEFFIPAETPQRWWMWWVLLAYFSEAE